MNNRQNRAPTRAHTAQIARGPQSHIAPAAPPPPPAYPAAPNAALLIDFDNVTMGIRSELATELKSLLSSDVIKGKIAIRRAYADWRRYPQYVLPLTETSIDLIYAPAYGSARKNATDIRLAIDAMELVFTRPEIGTIVLLSGDSDFSSLVIKLKEYGKYIIGVGIRESSSDLLVQNCDEYYSYNALAGLVKTGEEPTTKWDPWELASEAVARMRRNGDVMRADRLKQVMQEIDSTFEEKNLGMAKFSRFVTEAAQRGLLHITKLDNGQLEVDLPRTPADAAAIPVATQMPRADAAPAEQAKTGESDKAAAPSRERGRRGRGRGGRDRRPDAAEAGSAAAATSRATAPTVAAPMLPPGGSAGERLTRAEAFDLVRRAVEELSDSGLRTATASQVREKARALLGRDSESISERHFVRILHDAHDADIIDLRRRGDDYEVSRVAPTASVAEQLVSGAQTAAAAAAASQPPVRQGGGRSGRAAFGKRLGEAPPGLLSIGVVDFGVSHAALASASQPIPQPIPVPVESGVVVDEPAHEAKKKARAPRKRAPAKAAAADGAAPSKPARKRAAKPRPTPKAATDGA